MNTNILDFGAKGDGRTLCTNEIQKAIDACAATGGGRVTVPCGEYISGTIWLRDNVELHLEHASVIKGSENMDDYNAEDAYAQNFSSRTNEKWLGKHLIIAHECVNVAITGTGTLDGNADVFLSDPAPYSAYVWNEGCRTAKDPEACRPGQLVCFIECRHVTVRDITLTNQPCWGCFLHGCQYVTIIGMKAFNPHSNFNSDGIDIDCCSHVTVSDCIIDTGDDCIAIRGSENRLLNKPKPCEYITISNCVLGSASSTFRIGVGTSGSRISHVRVSNICITRGAPAVCIMSSYNGRGWVAIEDVSFSNMSVMNCARLFEIVEESGAPIKDIVLDNVRAETYGYVHLWSNSSDTVQNVVLRNVDIRLVDGPKPIRERDYLRRGTVWFRAENINGLKFENVSVSDPDGYLYIWNDGVFKFEGCDRLSMTGVKLNGEEYCY